MSAESDIFTALTAAGVAALVGDRVYPDALPEQGVYPAVVFARSGTEPIQSISGQVFGAFVEFGIAAWGKTRTSVDAVGDALEDALRAAGHNVTGREAGFDPETGLLATTIHATVLST